MIRPEMRPEDEVAWEIVVGTQVARLRDRVSLFPEETAAGKAARTVLEGLERTQRCLRDGFRVREACRTSGFCVLCDSSGTPWLSLHGRIVPARPWMLEELFQEAGLKLVPDQAVFLEPGLARAFITHSLAVVGRDLEEIRTARLSLTDRLEKEREPAETGRLRGALNVAAAMEGALTVDRAELTEAESEADLLVLRKRAAATRGARREFEN